MAENLGTIYYVVQANTQGVIDSLKPANASIDTLSKRFGESQAAGKQAEFQMTKTAQAIRGMGNESSSASGALGNLTKIAAGLVSLRAAGSIISMADSYQEYADRIQLATNNAEEYDYVQKRLLQNANATERQLEEAQELYLGTADSLRELGYSTSDVVDIGDSLSHSFAANAASSQTAQSAIAAFSKAMVRGKVDAMQWISITSAAPTVIEDIANASGRTTAEIRRLGSEGGISAKELAEALRESLEANKALDESMSMTVSGSMNKIVNAIKVYVGEANRAAGGTEVMAEALTVLAENFDKVANVLVIVGSAALGKYTAGLALSAISSAKATVESYRHAKSELDRAVALERSTRAAMATAVANKALGGSHAEAARRATAHATALKAAEVAKASFITVGSRLLGILGGPVGIIAMVASAAAAFLTMGRNARQAKGDIDLLNISLEEMGKKQLANMRIQLLDEIDALQGLSGASAKAAARVEYLNAQLASVSKSNPNYENWKREIVSLEAEIEKNGTVIEAHKERLKTVEELQKEISNSEASGVGTRDPEADKRLHGLRQELELAKLTGEARAKLQAIQRLGDRASPEQRVEAEKLAAEIYRLEEARKKATAATGESVKAAKKDADAAKKNAEAVKDLEQQLTLASLSGLSLAEARALATLNEFATPDEITRVKELAAGLHKVEQRARVLNEIGAQSPEKWILGDRDPLSGGPFDTQFSRFDQMAEQEEERLWEQMDRLNRALETEALSYEEHYRLVEQMTLEHSQRMNQIDEARAEMMMATASSTFDSIAGVMRSAAGEQSGIYKAMFAVSKAFALAESIVKIQQGIANAASLPYPTNIPAMAQVASATAGVISTIASATYGGGRQYGGPVSAGKGYRINENGAPEILNTASGQQYLLPNSRGQVVSNKDAKGGGQVNVSVVINSDGSMGVNTDQVGWMKDGEKIGRMVQSIVDERMQRAMQPGGTIRSGFYG